VYLLDTDHFGILQRETQPEFRHLMSRMTDFEPSDFFVSIVSFHEQTAGWYTYLNRAKNTAGVARAYAMFEGILADFTSYQVLGFGIDAAEAFDEWRESGIRVGTMDLRIAAIARANMLTVLTRNGRDFKRIPGISVEDWTIVDED